MDDASLHLAAIDEALDTLKRTIALFDPRYDNVIALACVGEGPRPDFRFGEACYSTAHRAALELLRAVVLHIENGFADDWFDGRFAAIDPLPDGSLELVLHALSPDNLREYLIDVCARPVYAWAVKEIEFAQVKEIQAWIHREWAAISRTSDKAPEAEIVHVTDEDWHILQALRANHPKLLTQEQIEGAIPQSRVALRTIQKRLPILRDEKKLVVQPEGARSGWGLSRDGFALSSRQE